MNKPLLFFLFIFSIPYGYAKCDATADAIILVNKEYHRYWFWTHDGIGHLSHETKIERRIRINSRYGLKKLQTLYIPTFEDADFEFQLASLKARTYKANGNVIELSSDAIKETTLPGNAPFLSNYSGQVKLLAFENVNIGDEIWYEYTVKYTTRAEEENVNIMDFKHLTREYPIKEASYTYEMGTKMHGRFHAFNTESKFSETDHSFRLQLSDVPATPTEAYIEEYHDLPVVAYHITNNRSTLYDSWENYLKERLNKAKKKTYFFGGKTIGEISTEVRSLKNSSAMQKMRFVRKLLTQAYDDNAEAVFQTYLKYEPDFTDAGQILKLLELIDVQGGVVFSTNRFRTPFSKDFISSSQFGHLFLEFEDENENTHLWNPFNPYSDFGQIPYECTGTKALRYRQSKGGATISFINMPENSSNSHQEDIHIDVGISNGKADIQVKNSIKETGAYILHSYPYAQLELSNENYDFFTDNMKVLWKGDHQYCEIDTVTVLKSTNPKQLDYEINYHYSLSTDFDRERVLLHLSDFVDDMVFTDLNEKRAFPAHFKFPFSKSYHIEITFPEGYALLTNQLLNKNIDNEIATLNVKSDFTENVLVLDIEHKLHVGMVRPADWTKYMSVIHEVAALKEQKLLLESRQ